MSIPKMWISKVSKIYRFLIIFLVITSWIFSGWPQIFNPSILFRTGFPPKIQKAQATVETFITAGTFTNGWMAPTGVTSVTAETWGGGGGSGGGTSTSLPGGSGGGGGAYASKVISVTPGNSYTYIVGAAGLKDGGTAGGNSSFTGDASVQSLACGGTSGASNGGTAGAGGTIACSDGTAEFAGGAGAAGAGTSGGGGGESAGTTATGGNASGTTGGTGTDGTDGSAGQLIGVNGVAGNNPGAGAGGSGTRSGGVEQGASGGVGQVRLTYTISSTTFLGNDTDPGSNPTIAPEAATTTVGTFNLKTSSGTDTVTNATTTLSAGSFNGLFGVEITNSGNTTIYCSSYNPSDVVVGLTGCNLPVTSASTTFNIRVKPKTHAAMDGPPGAIYTVSATTTAITATNSTSGSDTTSDTVTIDNASPNGATATSGTAGDQKVTLNWTTSSSGDFDTTSGSVIYRWAAASAGSETPDEGTTPSVGAADGTATVACVISSAASAAQSKIDGSAGSAGCTTTALTNGQQYTYVAFQRDTNGNYDVGVSIGTFTPAGVSLTFTIDTGNVSFVTAITPGTPVSTSSVLTVNTNNSTGYNIKINRASTTPTLILSADNFTTIPDTPNNNNWTAPAATSTAGPSAVWTVDTTKGLGFRLKLTGTVANIYSSIWWGTDDAGANALYSGISTSTAAQVIADTTLGSASNEKTVVEYKLDTSTVQRTGTYVSSPVVFTAAVNP